MKPAAALHFEEVLEGIFACEALNDDGGKDTLTIIDRRGEYATYVSGEATGGVYPSFEAAVGSFNDRIELADGLAGNAAGSVAARPARRGGTSALGATLAAATAIALIGAALWFQRFAPQDTASVKPPASVGETVARPVADPATPSLAATKAEPGAQPSDGLTTGALPTTPSVAPDNAPSIAVGDEAASEEAPAAPTSETATATPEPDAPVLPAGADPSPAPVEAAPAGVPSGEGGADLARDAAKDVAPLVAKAPPAPPKKAAVPSAAPTDSTEVSPPSRSMTGQDKIKE